MNKLLILGMVAVTATPMFALGSAGLTGSYNLHTGSCKSDTGEVKLTGTVDGKKVTMKFDTEYNGSPLTVTYTGTLDDSGNVQGDADVEPMGVTGDFKLSPVKSDAGAPAK